MSTVLRCTLCGLVMLWLAGCASTPDDYGNGLPPLDTDVDLSSIPPAVPHPEPPSDYGNPERYTVFGESYHPISEARAQDFVQTGIASWYGRDFHGQRTSSGETYNMFRMTAAHKTLPLPSYVRVTNLRNGKQVIVRVNDRGPFHNGRIIDLSYVAALKLGMVREGSAPVRIKTITAEDVHRPATRGNQAPTQAQTVTAPARNTATHTAAHTRVAAAGSSALYLQVGAFSQRHNAEQIAARLRRMGIDSIRIAPGRGNGMRLYRVRVGPFAGLGRRRAVRQRLTLQGIPVMPVRSHTVR